MYGTFNRVYRVSETEKKLEENFMRAQGRHKGWKSGGVEIGLIDLPKSGGLPRACDSPVASLPQWPAAHRT